MRALILSLTFTLGIAALATSVQAQSITPSPSQRDADMIGQPADRFGMIMAAQVSRNAERTQLARKAAKLINAGRCREATSLVRARNDSAMAQRVSEVCASPAES